MYINILSITRDCCLVLPTCLLIRRLKPSMQQSSARWWPDIRRSSRRDSPRRVIVRLVVLIRDDKDDSLIPQRRRTAGNGDYPGARFELVTQVLPPTLLLLGGSIAACRCRQEPCDIQVVPQASQLRPHCIGIERISFQKEHWTKCCPCSCFFGSSKARRQLLPRV